MSNNCRYYHPQNHPQTPPPPPPPPCVVNACFFFVYFSGMFVEEIAAKDLSVRIKMFAHRTIKQLLVTMVTVRNAGSAIVRLGLNSSRIADTEDLDITHAVNQSIGYNRIYSSRKRVLDNYSSLIFE